MSTPSQNVSLFLSATASVSPLRITLNWYSYVPSTGYTVYRKLKSDTSWVQLTTLSSGITQYIDSAISQNIYYEYKVSRSSSYGTANGYVSSGVNVSEIGYRGKMFLVVDDAFTSPLSAQLSTLELDLIGDGWTVTRLDVSRSSTPASVRSQIKTIYDTSPSNDKPKLIFLLGHIPVYRSANTDPDGHGGVPWACDAFYGEMTNTWTTPPNNIPSDIEMQVGRVDFADLPAFGQTEVTMMSNYLTKLHNFKIRSFIPSNRMVIRDNFVYTVYSFSESMYRAFGSLVWNQSMSNLTEISIDNSNYGNALILSAMSDPSGYLWGHQSGGGTYNNMDSGSGQVLATSNFASTDCNIVFNTMFGSYFGNWDKEFHTDNLLRAPLASGKCLTNCWVGQPAWHFHHMGMGDPIGYSTVVSMNNRTSNALYQPQNNGWLGQGYTTIHLGLMGDPSLRMVYVNRPTNFEINISSGYNFSWSAASSVDGYNIYHISSGNIPSKVNSTLITGTTFSSPTASGTSFMIRSVKLERNSYYNMSIGVFGTASSGSSPNFSVKAFLGGAYFNGSMRDDLRIQGLIPLNDPYPSIGYTHSGIQTLSSATSSIFSIQGNDAPIDWVVVEMRSSATPSMVLQSIPCLVRKNGNVVTPDNNPIINSPLATGSYHIAIRHRNHLGIMTGSPITVNSSGYVIDFTNSSTSVYGTSSRMVIGSHSCLWSGNVNFNGHIKYTGQDNDKDPILVRIGGSVASNTITGYYQEDVNLDGVVKYTGSENDRDIILQNIGGSVPTNFKTEQLP